ncbi:MAG TPA: heme-binding domain-containing protein [Planctomycetota bacterium]|nr:heme-binding domain-containing protein [Planctomycetota bacterium]
MKRFAKRVLIVGLALFLLIQLVPYGRGRAVHPETAEPKWDSPRTRELAVRACFDCHSNQTHWPWYTWIAPASWLVQHDVDEGREHLDLTLFDQRQRNADECADQLRTGEMPPWQYLLLHPKARLDDAERVELAEGFEQTFGGD